MTHVEPVRYGKGSNAMGLLSTILVDGSGRRGLPRWLRFLLQVLRHPYVFARSLSVRRWSEKTIIVLVMQTLDNSITVRRGRRGKLTSAPGHGAPNPTWIPVAHEATRRIAEEIGGYPGGTRRRHQQRADDRAHHRRLRHLRQRRAPASSTPTTGCTATRRCTSWTARPSARTSGVNPSLTITAQAERAMSLWPNAGEPDTRPAQGPAVPPAAGRATASRRRPGRCARSAAPDRGVSERVR